MIRKIRAFVLGVYEHKLDCTTHFDEPEIEWYDKGRDIAKRLYALSTTVTSRDKR